jgi:hypothetical protein
VGVGLFFRCADYGKGVAAPDQRRIIPVYIQTVTEFIQQAADDQARCVYAEAGPTSNEDRNILQPLSPSPANIHILSDKCNYKNAALILADLNCRYWAFFGSPFT